MRIFGILDIGSGLKMEYIVHKRFKENAICGKVNLPALTICTESGGMIYHNGKPLCSAFSQNAYKYFARNDDKRGLERGKLVTAITTALEKQDEHYQERWDKIWADPACRQFKRPQSEDHWLWNFAFYNAEIFSLEHIAKLVGC